MNDRFGHFAGDQVLDIVARRLQKLVRPGDLVARYGGDEFVIVARASTPVEAPRIVLRIRAVLNQRMELGGRACFATGASLGVALLRQTDTPVALLARADQDMLDFRRSAPPVWACTSCGTNPDVCWSWCPDCGGRLDPCAREERRDL